MVSLHRKIQSMLQLCLKSDVTSIFGYEGLFNKPQPILNLEYIWRGYEDACYRKMGASLRPKLTTSLLDPCAGVLLEGHTKDRP